MRCVVGAAVLVAFTGVAFFGDRPVLRADVKDRRVITWAGRSWKVKEGRERGPGPNGWSAGRECVRVDGEGALHLAITPNGGSWNCSELEAAESLGFGEYRWTIVAELGLLSPRSVLGLFLYEDDDHEIDFEFSRWGKAEAVNAQFVLQPSMKDSKRRFSTGKAERVTCSLIWRKGEARFRCWAGEDVSRKPLAEWTYTGKKVPKAGRERVHMNFWLVGGKAEPGGKRQEVVVKSFVFRALEK